MALTGKNIKIIFKYVLAPALAAWLFYSLYKQVKQQPHLLESLALIRYVPFGENAWKFWLTVILVFFNWGFEARKWQFLTSPIERISFLRAFRSVLSGVTLSLNTPNRIGEYGGRILYLREGNKLKGISLSIAGSISQLIITLFMGCSGLSWLLIFILPKGASIMGLSHFWIEVFLIVSIIVTIMVVLFFFRLAWLIRAVEKIPRAGKLIPYISVLDKFENKILLSLLGISFLRYCVFILQYILLWQILDVNIDWISGVCLVSILFLVMAVVPSFAIADLGIRGQFSVALVGYFSANTIGIIGTTLGIWILNLFLPAVAGSLMILGIKFNKRD